jgi:hypothetical protein
MREADDDRDVLERLMRSPRDLINLPTCRVQEASPLWSKIGA